VKETRSISIELLIEQKSTKRGETMETETKVKNTKIEVKNTKSKIVTLANLKIKDTEYPKLKMVRSEHYNLIFDKTNGNMIRFGKTPKSKDDPEMAPAFEILDYELSTRCNNGCKFCYKGNSSTGKTVDLDQFKYTISKLKSINPIWCQVAYGVGSLSYLPDLEEMLQFTRDNDIVPNITVACFEDEWEKLDAIKRLCGACAISNYDIQKTFSLAAYMAGAGSNLQQINIHQLLSQETYDNCTELLHYMKEHPENPINAVVFLWIKPCGRAVNNFHPVNQDQLDTLINFALEHSIGMGFDSCSAHFVLQNEKMKQYKAFVEPCESTLFSAYLSVDGNFSPCSFTTQNTTTTPISRIITIHDISEIDDLWYSKCYTDFREKLTKGDRRCPTFELCCAKSDGEKDA
jgi:hypothetical protein